jgi:DNA-binding Lrp family transcriptional regulator
MRQFDDQEVLILKELIMNPRISDNKVSKLTHVPVMTVNRKRKKLEAEGMLNYYVDICHSKKGTNDFNAKQLYILKFRSDILKNDIINAFIKDPKMREFSAEHIPESHLAEKDGRLALILFFNAESEIDLIDSFNGKMIPMLKKHFGEDAIIDIITTRIVDLLSVNHNYLPNFNMESGVIKKDWDKRLVFVDRKSYAPKEEKKLHHFQ